MLFRCVHESAWASKHGRLVARWPPSYHITVINCSKKAGQVETRCWYWQIYAQATTKTCRNNSVPGQILLLEHDRVQVGQRTLQGISPRVINSCEFDFVEKQAANNTLHYPRSPTVYLMKYLPNKSFARHNFWCSLTSTTVSSLSTFWSPGMMYDILIN